MGIELRKGFKFIGREVKEKANKFTGLGRRERMLCIDLWFSWL